MQAMSSPRVRFMTKALLKSGCPVGDSFFSCRPCEGMIGGYFDFDQKQVVLCENKIINYSHVVRSLTHELIHAYDYCRADVTFENCRHHACTEIRAANLSGDCHMWNEWKRTYLRWAKQHPECVKRRALLSIQMNPNCSGGAGQAAIDEVWESCYNDLEPFGSVP